MKVFFDASIIIAALLSPTGGSAKLLELVKECTITGIISQDVIEEIVEEDKAKRIKRSKGEVVRFVANSGLTVTEPIAPEEIAPYRGQVDGEDAYLIVGANLTQCTHLVTLDKKHLLRSDIQERFLPLRILSPKETLEEFRAMGLL